MTPEQRTEVKELKFKDLKAKNYLFQAIDISILETILCKETSKHIWDSMKTKYQGSTKAKRQQLQSLCSEFETLRMKERESASDYMGRVMTIVNQLRINGDKTADVTVVEKILRSMTSKYDFVVCAIEEANDLDEITLDELESSLRVHEKKFIKHTNEGEQALKATTDGASNRDRGRGRGRGQGRGNSPYQNQE
ncbi:PREDICTED: uncharacterized protein LOC109191239 [Ipomoea nil]|uniref:uncharacterized protein LOC109191239 n=1 Tax=Ipomoea nil TaxID=35883 RepID=UPI0009016926|nr:PREDICTED: uncharacterized protein LOC109191239 [Ipomoea nil]